MQEDRILQTMPNVAMSLHVLCEMSSPDSFWLPYLSILVSNFISCLIWLHCQIIHVVMFGSVSGVLCASSKH